MANGHGGYRAPEHPAPVSGPSALSRRTDGGPGDKQALSAPTGLDYGEHKQLIDQQRAQPLPAQPSSTAAAQSSPSVMGREYSGTPLNAPTQRPGEPVTHGVDIGPGDGAAAVPVVSQTEDNPMVRLLTTVAPADRTGVIASLLQFAQIHGG